MRTDQSLSPKTQLPNKKHHWRPRFLGWSIAVVVLLLALLTATIYVLTKTESGTRTLLNNLSLFIPGQLSAELVSGSIDRGLELQNIQYVDGEKRILIDRITGKWSLSYSPLFLKVSYLKIGTVEATLPPSPPEEPTTLPEGLNLPLAVGLQHISVEKIILHQEKGDAVYKNILLHANTDKVHHAVQLTQAETPYGRAAAHLKLDGSSYETSGIVSLAGSYREQAFQLNIDLSGTLKILDIKARFNSGEATGAAVVTATPFQPIPLQLAEISVRNFNPNSLNSEWPQAMLNLNAFLLPAQDSKEGSGLAVQGPVSMSNSIPGAIDQDRIPVASMQAHIRLDPANRQLSQLNIKLVGGAFLTGAGQLNDEGDGDFKLEASRLDMHALHTRLATTRLDGPLTVRMAGDKQFIEVGLTEPKMSILAKAELAPEQILLHQAQLISGQALLEIQGKLARKEASDYAFSGKLRKFNPALFMSAVESKNRRKSGRSYIERIQANVNMDFQAEGSLKPELSSKFDFNIFDSMYASQPMQGRGEIHFSGLRVHSSDANLNVAGNNLSLIGSFGQPADRLRFRINAPHLPRLGFGISGLLQAEGELQGTLEQPQIMGQFRATDFKTGNISLSSMGGNIQLGGLPASNPDARTVLNVALRNFRQGDVRLAESTINIDGTYSNHSARIETKGGIRTLSANLILAARGKLSDTGQGLGWAGTISKFENKAKPEILLSAPMKVDYMPGRLALSPARLSIARSLVELKSFLYSDKLIQSQGSFSKLDTAYLLALYREFSASPLPLSSSMVLDGKWDVSLSDTAGGFVQIERTQGDVTVTRGAREFPLGLKALSLRANFKGTQLQFDTKADAARIGNFGAQGMVNINPAGPVFLEQQAPFSAQIRAQVPRLQNLAAFAGPAVTFDGEINANLSISGTVGEPSTSGTITADRLSLTMYDQGVRLNDGTARLRIDNNILEIQKLELRGGGGFVRAVGRIPLDQSNPQLSANIVAEKLQLLASPSGQLTLSGQATAANVNQQLLVTGKFTVDRALFSLPEKRAPQLDDDVIVIRDSKTPAASEKSQAAAGSQPTSPYSPRVSIVVDLGDRFLFKGSGADLRLAGSIRIESEPGQTPQAFGTVRIPEGTYEAFGAELNIERGIFNFQGPLNNPSINIIAMRREQEVSAGVQVTGTVDQPRIQLISEPNLSEEEKLSWLVFGRAGGGTEQGQAQAAAQGAALGLLNKLGGKRIGSKLGLDELSIGKSEAGLGSEQVVNLGKEITDRLFIGFEQSLASATSVVKITYELSRHWSVVLRGGDVTGIAMSYNNRFNSLFRKSPPVSSELQIEPK